MLLYVHRNCTGAQDVHLDFHTAPDLFLFYFVCLFVCLFVFNVEILFSSSFSSDCGGWGTLSCDTALRPAPHTSRNPHSK